jgi:isoquinoline 1-oxidoreductase alpha subunit
MPKMTVNGQALDYRLDPQTPLLWALRDASNLTGTKHGCSDGSCGACTVIVDGRAQLSCTLPIATLEGSVVTTIEGLSQGRAHPIQQAWLAEQVTQCGFCEPGFIMALAALLQASPRPSREQVEALPNRCACGAQPRILRAIERAVRTLASTAPAQRQEEPHER